MADAVHLEGVVKTYGTTTALQGVDLSVPPGSVTALLGPNGAGKTTIVKVLTTLVRPDRGRASVLGHDVVRHPAAVRSAISVVGQDTTVEQLLTARENLVHFGRLAGLPKRRAGDRAAELLTSVDLEDAADRRVSGYSGGMGRRLDLACSLVARPAVLFLDEPTVGLDPVNRRQIWAIIRERVQEGATILLTTQQLDEAEELSHQVCILDRGRVVRTGTREQLAADLPGDHIDVVLGDPADLEPARTLIAQLCGREPVVDADLATAHITAHDGAGLIPPIVRTLHEHHLPVQEITMRRPTLEDIYLAITGSLGER